MIDDPYLKELRDVYLREGTTAALNHIQKIVNGIGTDDFGIYNYRDFELYNFGNREINKALLLCQKLNTLYWYYTVPRGRSDTLLRQIKELNVLLARDPPRLDNVEGYEFIGKLLEKVMDQVVKQIADERDRKFLHRDQTPGSLHVEAFEQFAAKLAHFGFDGPHAYEFKKQVMLDKLSK